MAKPELNDGFTRIANEILGALSRINLSAYETSVLLFIFRNTYGWQRKEDLLALEFIAEKTGIRKQHVCRTLGKLRKKKMIVMRKDARGFSLYGFQKDYENWAVTWRGNEPYQGPTSDALLTPRQGFKECARCGWDEGILDKHHLDDHRIVPLCPNCHRLVTYGVVDDEALPKEAIVTISGKGLTESGQDLTNSGKDRTWRGTQQRKKKERYKESSIRKGNHHPLPKEVTEREKTMSLFVRLYTGAKPGYDPPFSEYPSELVQDEIELMAEKWGDDVAQDAIRQAAKSGKAVKPKRHYIEAIIQRWKEEGRVKPIISKEEYERLEAEKR